VGHANRGLISMTNMQFEGATVARFGAFGVVTVPRTSHHKQLPQC
jgi:hypothetical protein